MDRRRPSCPRRTRRSSRPGSSSTPMASGSISSTGAGRRSQRPRRRCDPGSSTRAWVMGAGRAPARWRTDLRRSSRWTCAVTACRTPRPRTAPTTCDASPTTSSPSPRALGCSPRTATGSSLAGHGFGGDRRGGAAAVDLARSVRRARPRRRRLGVARGGDRHGRRRVPARPRRAAGGDALDGGVPRRPRGFDPATWDADQERAARATVVETHAGRVVPATRPHALEAQRARDVRVRPAATLPAVAAPIDGARRRRRRDADRARGRWPRRSAARASGRSRRRSGASRSATIGHNLMRYRPDEVAAAILSRRRPTGREGRPMQVVYSPRPPRPRHRHRDVHGRRRSRPTRSPSGPRGSARRSRRTAASRSSSRREHGEAPITAVHDPGLVRFLEVAWSEVRAQGDPAAVPVRGHVPEPGDVRGHVRRGDRRGSSASRRTSAAGPASGASTPRPRSSPGTYVRGPCGGRRRADDGRTSCSAGERAAYGLCRPPGHHAARSMYGGYCFFNNAAIAAQAIVRRDRRAGRDPRRRLPPRQRHAADLLAARRRPLRLDPRRSRRASTRTSSGRADETGEGEGAGENLNIPLRAGRDERRLPRGDRPGARGDRRGARLGRRRVARLRYLRPRPDRRLRPDDRRLPRGRAGGWRRSGGAW